jgi:hypothetical protein
MIHLDKDPTLKTLLQQEALAARGYYEGPIDNWEGPRMKAAYSSFLKDMKKAPTVMESSAPKGPERTDWRGYVDISPSALAGVLPASAKPLAGSFLKWAKTHGLNPLFLVAISRHETGAWTSNVFRTKNNAMGISNAKGAVRSASYDDSIRIASRSLSRPGGFYSKAKSLADVGAIYAPVGAANDPTKVNSYWPGLVSKYMADLEKQLA